MAPHPEVSQVPISSFTLFKDKSKLDVVVHICNHSTQEAEPEGSLKVQGQLGQ